MKRRLYILLSVFFMSVAAFIVVESSRLNAWRPAPISNLPNYVVADRRLTNGENVPSAIRRYLPSKAISRFWGTFRLQVREPSIGVFVYTSDWGNSCRNGFEGRPSTTYALLFEQRGKVWKKLRRLKSFSIQSVHRMEYSAQQMWLDPKTRKSPMFAFQAFGYEEPRGLPTESLEGAGDEIVLTFPRGLRGSYAVQRFAIGYWRASDTLGQDLTYRTTDKHELLQITTLESLNDEGNPTRTSIYEWKKSRFVQVSRIITQH